MENNKQDLREEIEKLVDSLFSPEYKDMDITEAHDYYVSVIDKLEAHSESIRREAVKGFIEFIAGQYSDDGQAELWQDFYKYFRVKKSQACCTRPH